jgi:4-amino-4-deoxy-L-arabinose transferase-like glycosyltransferase
VAREVNAAGLSRSLNLSTLGVVALILLRGIVLAATPISFDEAYYWLWSKHLAAGYLDHPPLIAFLIRGGTALFGDSSIGVRFLPWLLSIAATWAVWRATAKMLKSREASAIAALLFNLMPMIAIESGIATPDSPEICATAFVLLCLAQLAETGYGGWWIAAGIAAGFALLAKYTAFFIGAGILLWLAAVPVQRHWFKSPWPYAGAAVALLMFLPVVLWNAEHGWISFARQFGRTGEGAFTLRYLGEFITAQLLLATPFIAVLVAAGAVFAFRRSAYSQLRLVVWMIAPAAIYFLAHSLHDRVQGNWPSFVYPALAISAAAAFVALRTKPASAWLRWSRQLAVPVAALAAAAIYGQALFGIIPQVRDPVSRLLAYGMAPVVTDIDSVRKQEHASAIATTSYALTGWLAFYLPQHPAVIQLNERLRFLNEPAPDPQLLHGPLIYVTQLRNDQTKDLANHFAHVTPLGQIARRRNGALIDQYALYRLDGPSRSALSFDTGG